MSLTPEEQAKIGGSDVTAILGLSQWSTPLQLYVRIVSALEGRPLKSEDNGDMRRGRHLERAVLALYAEETGATLLPAASLSQVLKPWARASLDSRAERNGRRVVEVKTAGLTEARKWGEAGTDAVPQAYVFQTTWYVGHALAAGAVDVPEADVAALVAGDLRVYHVGFDAELFAMLEAAAERFWVDYVLPRRPPPPTELLKDVEAVGSLYPRHEGEARQWDALATEEQVAVREYLRARQERKRAEALEAAWEARLKLALGTIPRLEGLPPDTGAKALTWRQNKGRMETDWRAVAERASKHVRPDWYKEIVNEFTTTKDGARPLRVSEREDEA
jgi:putative phage-type endonuclease